LRLQRRHKALLALFQPSHLTLALPMALLPTMSLLALPLLVALLLPHRRPHLAIPLVTVFAASVVTHSMQITSACFRIFNGLKPCALPGPPLPVLPPFSTTGGLVFLKFRLFQALLYPFSHRFEQLAAWCL
jgi:hypothetical protein